MYRDFEIEAFLEQESVGLAGEAVDGAYFS